MNRNFFLSMVAVSVILSGWPGIESHAAGDAAHAPGADAAADEIPKGPHGGKLFEDEAFAIELVLYETGVPPEFHVYAWENGELLAPQNVDLRVELTRVDGEVDRFAFQPLNEYLRGQGVVREPHSFDVHIEARYGGKTFNWHYSSYEGRTEIPDALAQDAGIETEIAGRATLAETLVVTGRVQADPARLAEVRARFPGIVQRIDARLGQTVSEGEVLARIQSNESLQTYTLKAPIGGVILRREVQLNMVTGAEPLFVIVDLSQVWVELDIFSRQIGAVKAPQPVTIETLNATQYTGRIDWVAPLAAHASQSVQARVILDNANGELRPGQFVRGRITVAEHPVKLAVRQSAIQRFRDFQVVFARFGETYEVRMLELGRQNSEWAEVLGGLSPGTEYVTANSYLIKADIEKSGASHDH